jgi:hypothetical protein
MPGLTVTQRDCRWLRGRGRGLREQLGSAAVLRGPGEGMEPVQGLRALHRRRGKDGHDQDPAGYATSEKFDADRNIAEQRP